MDLSAILSLITQHKWVALSAFLIGLVVRVLKSDTALPFSLPPRARVWLALGLGVTSGVLDKVANGTPWKDAIVGGLAAALVAILGHETLIESARGGKEIPLPVLTKSALPTNPPLGVLIFVGACSLGASISVAASCRPVEKPNPPMLVEAGVGVVDNSCTLLEGVTQNQTVISICAYAEEVATIASFVLSFMHHNALPSDAGACVPIANSGVCATKAEIGQAIQMIVQKRKIRLTLNAGATQTREGGAP